MTNAGMPVVTGSGTTPHGASDHFFGSSSLPYAVTIAPGATLAALCDNTATPSPALTCASKANELINMGGGSLINHGSLQSYPSESPPGPNYQLTNDIVDITNASPSPMLIQNYGTIGNESGPGGFYGPLGYYGQGDAAGILIAGQATVTNESGGYIGGYNAFFTTSGSGTLDNYGTIFGVNDGILSGYTVTNHPGAALLTGIQGYASIHEYGTFDNYGYVLGSDFAVLIFGGAFTDYGGAVVPGVTDAAGGAVYNGEISAIVRGAKGPSANPTTIGTPVTGGAAIEMDGNNLTVNLVDQEVGGVVRLPDVAGPIEGGFNGTEASASENNTNNTLAFDFPDISSSQATAFQTALADSKQSNGKGAYYTGSTTITENGISYTYEWDNVAKLTFDGIAIP